MNDNTMVRTRLTSDFGVDNRSSQGPGNLALISESISLPTYAGGATFIDWERHFETMRVIEECAISSFGTRRHKAVNISATGGFELPPWLIRLFRSLATKTSNGRKRFLSWSKREDTGPRSIKRALNRHVSRLQFCSRYRTSGSVIMHFKIRRGNMERFWTMGKGEASWCHWSPLRFA